MTTDQMCERCQRPDEPGRRRRLWDRGPGDGTHTVRLCDDCNDVVQGPDHVDISTDNLA